MSRTTYKPNWRKNLCPKERAHCTGKDAKVNMKVSTAGSYRGYIIVGFYKIEAG